MTSDPVTATGNFIRQAIDNDLESGALAGRHWSGHPGVAAVQRLGPPDGARIRTRFQAAIQRWAVIVRVRPRKVRVRPVRAICS